HAARMDELQMWQPLSGWLGHASPFEFSAEYRPAPAVRRFVCGTPSPIALAALDCGVDTVLAAEPLGGMDALRQKSLALTDLFIALLGQQCRSEHIDVKTPAEYHMRGSQVSFTLGDGAGSAVIDTEARAYATVQALIARGVIGDFRAPGILRFGFTPLYLRYTDVWDAVDHLANVLSTEEWRHPRFTRRSAVT
ncbi:MAG: kynureninase, partial [Gemmatimonadaceae bacterium]